jgi:hypothetical protein
MVDTIIGMRAETEEGKPTEKKTASPKPSDASWDELMADPATAGTLFDQKDTRQSSELTQLWQQTVEGGIPLIGIAPKVFLGLVQGRRHTSPLRIGEYLFIFAPRQNVFTDLSDFTAQILRCIPPDAWAQMPHLRYLTQERLMATLSRNNPDVL